MLYLLISEDIFSALRHTLYILLITVRHFIFLMIQNAIYFSEDFLLIKTDCCYSPFLLITHCFQIFVKGCHTIDDTVICNFNNAVCNGLYKLVVMRSKQRMPLKSIKPLLTAVIDSKSSDWLVDPIPIRWSRIIIRESIQRTFSPPESTLTGFNTSSPENNIFPRKPLK